MLTMPSFKKSLIVEQFQRNYLKPVLEPLAYRPDLGNREIRLKNINSFSTRRQPLRYRRLRCLSSLIFRYAFCFQLFSRCL